MPNERMTLLNELVSEVERDDMNIDRIKELMGQLGINYTDDPMQLLNNILKGIHSEGPIHEQSGNQ